MTPIRLEFVATGSRKAWEVQTNGPKMTVRYGRLGTQGRVLTKTFDSAREAKAAAAKLIETKLKKGYVKNQPRPAPSRSSASSMSADAFASPFLAWLEAAGKQLKAPKQKVRPPTFAKGVVVVTHNKHKICAPISAPISLLASFWRDDAKTVERICLETPGSWNAVITLLRCDGSAHDRYMDLVTSLHGQGLAEEARIAWLQAKSIGDPDDRRDPLFHELFPKLPRVATQARARSAAAYLERLLPMLNKKTSQVDRFILATELYEHMGEAMLDVSGSRKREARFRQLIEDTIALLARSDALAVRDLTKLTRLQFARIVALSPYPGVS